jgi:hypothetical protein
MISRSMNRFRRATARRLRKNATGTSSRYAMARAALAVVLGAVSMANPVAAAETPRLYFHENYVEDATRVTELPIKDTVAMFEWVLGNLKERVKVYPTENYYYFYFIYNGTRYAGNIRLDASDRDRGKVHFAYYEDLAEWKDEEPVNHMALDKKQGVTVEKVDRLTYRVSYKDKAVVFELNDLAKVVPPASILGPDEKYLGPVFDDSAVRFFLVYNTRLKIFHYLLDETITPSDVFFPAKSTDRILIGRRTGFAFYRDVRLDRKILIGVFEGNARVNNYFDGPFDQLPDNFLEGDTLRRIILQIEPGLAGQIDRFGGSPDGSSRFLIAPYLHYREVEELDVFHQCATSKDITPDIYYACFVIDPSADEATAAPDADKPAKKRAARSRHRTAHVRQSKR